jgi:hypothetical protein
MAKIIDELRIEKEVVAGQSRQNSFARLAEPDIDNA